jgi:hypothetical protein
MSCSSLRRIALVLGHAGSEGKAVAESEDHCIVRQAREPRLLLPTGEGEGRSEQNQAED